MRTSARREGDAWEPRAGNGSACAGRTNEDRADQRFLLLLSIRAPHSRWHRRGGGGGRGERGGSEGRRAVGGGRWARAYRRVAACGRRHRRVHSSSTRALSWCAIEKGDGGRRRGKGKGEGKREGEGEEGERERKEALQRLRVSAAAAAACLSLPAMKIKAVIFDIGGVVVRDPALSTCPSQRPPLSTPFPWASSPLGLFPFGPLPLNALLLGLFLSAPFVCVPLVDIHSTARRPAFGL